MKQRIITFIITGVLIILAFVLQSAISLRIGIGVAVPNLLLIVTCFFGFMRGSNFGSVTGIVCGLIVDIFFSDVIGLCALIYLYVGFLSGLFNKMFYSKRIFMPTLLVLLSDLMYNFVYYFFRFLLRNKLDFPYYFWKIILPEMIITAIVALVLYELFYILNEKVLTKDQENTLSFDK